MELEGKGVKYILLDTSVLVNCTLVNAADADPELLVALVDRMRDQGVKLLLPDVIRFEYARKVPEELALISQQTKRFRDSVTTSDLPGPDVSRIHETLDKLDSDRVAAAKRAQAYVLQVAADPEITVSIALDGDALAEAVGYVLAGQKPSSGRGVGLLDPDSLIVASVARFVRAHGLSDDDTLLVCSDNHKDFARWDPDEKTHVIADSIAAAIPCELRYYKSPRLLLEQELEIVVEADQPLSDALDDYDQLSDTMSSINRWADTLQHLRALPLPAIDPSFLESMRRASTIDQSISEILKRATIDPSILESMRRASTIDQSISEILKRATIDPSILESMRRATNIDPELLRRLQNAAEDTANDEGDVGESKEQEDEGESDEPTDVDDANGGV